MEANKLLRKGLVLEYTTLSWNIVECVLVLMAGIAAGSIALIGFGIDSIIEILASLVVVWQLKSINKDKEKFAEKLIGVAFLLLSLYIFIEATYSIFEEFHAKTSYLGMLILFLTAIVMFALAHGKKKVGMELGNPVLIRESKVTYVDGLLASSVLLGIVLDALLGWWWADPLVGFLIVFYGIKEGFHALKS